MKAVDIQKLLRAESNSVIAEQSTRFFKTNSGEYAEGDVFLGIRVPVLRGLVKTFSGAPLNELVTVLRSRFHEERLFALFVLVFQYERADATMQQKLVDTYLKNTRYINNWDLVDSSAYKILGPYLFDKNREVLVTLATSTCMWERRIAIISTLYFIKNEQYEDTLKIARVLLQDEQDLIHKAVGWMLREVGNKDKAIEESFLKTHYSTMPRTMLRYAIEKFSKQERQAYLSGMK
ncbi:MAG: DNA alkylation repair protein [Granulosicoccus sp.]